MLRLLLIIIVGLLLMGLSCEKNEQLAARPLDEKFAPCLKGKLLLKGICMNYVIQLVDGNIDTNRIHVKWINPMTKVEYKNVFGLASICTFPETIAEGQEFYFSVLDKPDSAVCVRCKAYAPVPDKMLHISICKAN
jgi:hypothetical protein